MLFTAFPETFSIFLCNFLSIKLNILHFSLALLFGSAASHNINLIFVSSRWNADWASDRRTIRVKELDKQIVCAAWNRNWKDLARLNNGKADLKSSCWKLLRKNISLNGKHATIDLKAALMLFFLHVNLIFQRWMNDQFPKNSFVQRKIHETCSILRENPTNWENDEETFGFYAESFRTALWVRTSAQRSLISMNRWWLIHIQYSKIHYFIRVPHVASLNANNVNNISFLR